MWLLVQQFPHGSMRHRDTDGDASAHLLRRLHMHIPGGLTHFLEEIRVCHPISGDPRCTACGSFRSPSGLVREVVESCTFTVFQLSSVLARTQCVQEMEGHVGNC